MDDDNDDEEELSEGSPYPSPEKAKTNCGFNRQKTAQSIERPGMALEVTTK
jgi:hypothetical protein